MSDHPDSRGDPDRPFRGEIRLVSQRRVSHGLGVPKRTDLSPEAEFQRDLRAYLMVLPPSAAFTHLTGARMRGWDLPRLPEQMPVFVAVDGDVPRPRRPGLICSRLTRDRSVPETRGGLPVDSAEEILLRAARDLGLLDVLVLLESALHLGDVDPDRLERLLASRRPGVRMLRRAWQRATGRSESMGETVLQEFHRVMGVGFEPQADLYDADGGFIARADLLVEGTLFVHEYDGEHHRRGAQQRRDLRRDRRLAESTYRRRGYVLDDLVNHPAVTMHELDRSLGRPHRIDRLQAWRRLVENSLLSEVGRSRMMNRWRRISGLVDWSGSA